jgi:hypothetical protein
MIIMIVFLAGFTATDSAGVGLETLADVME